VELILPVSPHWIFVKVILAELNFGIYRKKNIRKEKFVDTKSG